MFGKILIICLFLLTVSMMIALFRLFKGASLPDRALALDSISYIIIGIIAILSIVLDTKAYLDIILLIGILAFLSTIALCRFIERGAVIERNKRD